MNGIDARGSSSVVTVGGGEIPMGASVAAGREFWLGVLLGGGFTAIPRWAREPAAGVLEYEVAIPADLVAALRRRAEESAVSLSSVLLAGHAKVLAALSGEREVGTGYVSVQGGRALPCRLSTEPESWLTLLHEAQRVEWELLAHQDIPVEDLRRELGLTGPAFETVFDPALGVEGDRGELAEETALRVGVGVRGGQLVLRLAVHTE